MSRLPLVLVIGLTGLACSSGGGTSTGSGTSTTTGTGGHTSTSSSTTGTGTGGHMNTCVQPGDKGNSIGVGKYCTPGGGECTGLAAGLCTGDVGPTEWFCVKIGCQKDSDCAEMATCVTQTGGSGCVPNKCLQGGNDGGTDGGEDAGKDGG